MAPRNKLSRSDAAWIKGVLRQDRRERLAAGMKHHTHGLMQRLADKFGVSVWTIQSIRKRRRWKYLKPNRWGDPLPATDGDRNE